jgi:hypothetical protein
MRGLRTICGSGAATDRKQHHGRKGGVGHAAKQGINEDSVMETKPLLMPHGSTRKKKVTSLVEPGSRTVLFRRIHRKLFSSNFAMNMM